MSNSSTFTKKRCKYFWNYLQFLEFKSFLEHFNTLQLLELYSLINLTTTLFVCNSNSPETSRSCLLVLGFSGKTRWAKALAFEVCARRFFRPAQNKTMERPPKIRQNTNRIVYFVELSRIELFPLVKSEFELAVQGTTVGAHMLFAFNKHGMF